MGEQPGEKNILDVVRYPILHSPEPLAIAGDRCGGVCRGAATACTDRVLFDNQS